MTGKQMARPWIAAAAILCAIVLPSLAGAMVCSRDLNGNGVIDPATERVECLGSTPPVCPIQIAECAQTGFSVSGNARLDSGQVLGRQGFTQIDASAATGSLRFAGWQCTGEGCAKTTAGILSFPAGSLSGSATAGRITRLAGNGDRIDVYGCRDLSDCAEGLVGQIVLEGATFKGSARSPGGFTEAVAGGNTISFTGVSCGEAGCSTFSAGDIVLQGSVHTCPAGPHPCVNVNGVFKCSPNACIDETAGGTVPSGSKVCLKDLSGDGNIDFASEMELCTAVKGGDFCPLGAVNCGSGGGSSAPACPSGGTSCPAGGSYNASRDICLANTTVSYLCDETGQTYGDQAGCDAGCGTKGTCTGSTIGIAITSWTCSIDGAVYGDSASCGAKCREKGSCSVRTDCPEGYARSGNECVAAKTGGPSGTLNPSTDRCEAEPAFDDRGVPSCPSQYVYNASSRRCEADPVCLVGRYDPVKDVCSGEYTGCPYGKEYPCLPHPRTGLPQCSDAPCFTLGTRSSNTNQADLRDYRDDGTVNENGLCEGKIFIFNGKGRECKPGGMQTNFFNCCDTSEGSFGPISEVCGEEDARTAGMVGAGLCHPVGDYCKEEWPLIGCVQRANVYCCFNSKLGRIVHEQGRGQLKSDTGWGGAEGPNCRGFTPEEFQMLDFSRMDLSEFFGDISTKSKERIAQDAQKKVQDYYERIRQ